MPVEIAFIRKCQRLSPNAVAYITTKLQESYINVDGKFERLAEVKRVLAVTQTPLYQGIKADQAFLQEALQAYRPALQTEIQQVVFAIEELSTLVAQGKPYKRLIILLEGPPGMGKTRIIDLITQAFGLAAIIRVNFEGEDPNILFGTPTEMGRITVARQGVQTVAGKRIDTNANLMMGIEDVDRALKATKSAVYLHLLGERESTYYDPSIGNKGEHLPLAPVLFMTVNSLPQEQAVRDRCNYIIHFDDPFREEGYHAIACDYLYYLLESYAENIEALTLDDFTEEDLCVIKQLATKAKASKASIRQLQNKIDTYFLEKWQAYKRGKEEEEA